MLRTFIALLISIGTVQLLPADQWNKKTILQTNQAILIPGQTLPAGSYVIKLMDSPSSRHVVQFLNDREDHVYATVLAIPNYRLQPTGATRFSWWETPAGNPPAIRAWFYPGDNFGQEFAYPKGLTAQFDQTSRISVETTPASEPVQELRTAPPVEPSSIGQQPIDNAPREVAVARAPEPPAPAPEPAPAPTPAPPPQAQAPAQTPAPEPARTELPATGSYYLQVGAAGAVLGLLGLSLRKLAAR